MKMGFWRTVLLVVLAIVGMVLAMKFLGRVLALIVAAIPIVLIAYFIRHLWKSGRRQETEEPPPDDAFRRRHPRLASLEKRIKELDPNLDL